MTERARDPSWFRRVLGQYPTGVCVVTSMQPDGTPAGMVVGSFTSVSLDPPLVAFLPDKKSTTWPKIESGNGFCVNILSADQEDECRRFASKDAGKFDGVEFELSPLGAPIIPNCVAWIDCKYNAIHDAGDHFIVVGEVEDLEIGRAGLPLLFFQGGYGRFAPLSMATNDPVGGLSGSLRHLDIVRDEIEKLTSALNVRGIVTTRSNDEIVILASAGVAQRGAVPTLVGQRVPFIPPTSYVFAAWQDDDDINKWLKETSPAEQHEAHISAMQVVRNRGYSVGLISDAQREFVSKLEAMARDSEKSNVNALRELIGRLNYDPADLTPEVEKRVRAISAPIFDANNNVTLALTIHDLQNSEHGPRECAQHLLMSAARASDRIRTGH